MSNLATQTTHDRTILRGDATCLPIPPYQVTAFQKPSTGERHPLAPARHDCRRSLTLTGSGNLPYSPSAARLGRPSGVIGRPTMRLRNRRTIEWSGCDDCDDHEHISSWRPGVEAPRHVPAPERDQDRRSTP